MLRAGFIFLICFLGSLISLPVLSSESNDLSCRAAIGDEISQLKKNVQVLFSSETESCWNQEQRASIEFWLKQPESPEQLKLLRKELAYCRASLIAGLNFDMNQQVRGLAARTGMDVKTTLIHMVGDIFGKESGYVRSTIP